MEQCYLALSDQLDWVNPEGNRCPYDMSKPLPLQDKEWRLTIPNTSPYEVYSTMRILILVRVSVDKKLGYGYLKEITVKRAYQKLYTFKEEQALQPRRRDLVTALRMFTRSIVLKARVEDVQLGVESYQKKLNLTKPQLYGITKRISYAVTKSKPINRGQIQSMGYPFFLPSEGTPGTSSKVIFQHSPAILEWRIWSRSSSSYYSLFGYNTLIMRMPNMMLSYLDQWDKIPVTMTNVAGILRDNLDEILDGLFGIGAENLKKTEHEVPHRCDDKTVDITNYKDSDHEDGELPDLFIFSATNEFASVCEQVEENINIRIAEEKEEGHMEDVETDENYDIDDSCTKEALQWSLAPPS
ncbi:hypothetical protein Tco_0163759 [Tanacetum coccineum]